MNQSLCIAFLLYLSLQFENSQLRLINTFIKYSQCYSIHSLAWNTLRFYSCCHLQRGKKNIVNKGKEKKPDLGQYYLRQTYLKFVNVRSKMGVQREKLPAHTSYLTAGNHCCEARKDSKYWLEFSNLCERFETKSQQHTQPQCGACFFFKHTHNEAPKQRFRLRRVTQEWEVLLNREGTRNGIFFFSITSISEQQKHSLHRRPENTEMNRHL